MVSGLPCRSERDVRDELQHLRSLDANRIHRARPWSALASTTGDALSLFNWWLIRAPSPAFPQVNGLRRLLDGLFVASRDRDHATAAALDVERNGVIEGGCSSMESAGQQLISEAKGELGLPRCELRH
jgi:hypothetical protein